MLELDGSAGGGQLVRTALTCAAITGEPFRMENVRGERPNPGLRAQHLAGVRLLADICDAEVSEVEVGTEELTFEPGAVRPGRYEVDVGTAGSVTLVFDTVLPLALAGEGPLAVTATGGTDVKWSPPMAFYRRVKLPLFREWGLFAAVDYHRTGFYPAGGGRATLHLAPSDPGPLELCNRGPLTGVRVYSTASKDLRDADVAERQVRAAVEPFGETDLPVSEQSVTYIDSHSPGSALVAALDFESSIVGFSALGERGRPAEDVGGSAGEAARSFVDEPSAVDRYLADQVIPLLALSGGRVAIPEVTDHVASAVELVGEFGFDVAIESRGDGALLIGG